MKLSVVGGRVLYPDGTIERAAVTVEDGVIDSLDDVASDAAITIDAGGRLVLPGLVDIHGDAFERQIMPRPGVMFDLDIALHDTDRQLAANGITTAFHAITNSWETGLRGVETVRAILAALDRLRPRLDVDHRIHLRQETCNLDTVDEVEDWIWRGAVDLLAFNDHVPELVAKADDPTAMIDCARRAGLTVADYVALLRRTHARSAEVPEAIARLAATAREVGMPMLSHDENHPSQREWFHARGCAISEFPKNVETARQARALGDTVVMGSPNAVRGSSHLGAVDATALVRDGFCDVLASDYYYPALVHAPFRLHARGDLALTEAWRLVSENAARAAGLDDRGRIASGLRGDLVIIDDSVTAAPRVAATVVAGRPVFVSRDVGIGPSRSRARAAGLVVAR